MLALLISMAENRRRISNTDYCLPTTGIAGPGGGTTAKSLSQNCGTDVSPVARHRPDVCATEDFETAPKPIGLAYLALPTADDTLVKELHLGEHLSRSQIRDRTAKITLNLLRTRFMGH